MTNLLDGTGVYKRDVEEPILKPKIKIVELPPKDVRAVIIDGETYVNVKDLIHNAKRMSHLSVYSTLSANFLIKNLIYNLTKQEDL